MYHSIYIGDKNTWDDFKLVANSRPVVAMPEVRTVYVDVHGTDGTLDLTTALTGGVQYKNREGSWEFTVVDQDTNWEVVHHRLVNYLHGKKFKIILEDDPDFYYMGRLSVNDWESNEDWSTITIDYYLDPYKYELFNSMEPWHWDPFSFETGVVREYETLTVSGSYTLTVPGSMRPCIPKFIVNSTNHNGMTVTYDGTTYTFADGTSYDPRLLLKEDEADLIITGNGVITVLYQGGWL